MCPKLIQFVIDIDELKQLVKNITSCKKNFQNKIWNSV